MCSVLVCVCHVHMGIHAHTCGVRTTLTVVTQNHILSSLALIIYFFFGGVNVCLMYVGA